tara:strand:+ start:2413 stop:3768 length:1356 start_codon:yes stop_codon:yes gene_type:complete
MAKISSYIIDSTPQLTDKVIGTDVTDNDITKNYLIGDIVGLVPPPTLSPTKMFYGDAASVVAETNTLTYIVGGQGIIPEDTTVIGGTLICNATNSNNDTSLTLGKGVVETQSPAATVAVGIQLATTLPTVAQSVLVGYDQMVNAQTLTGSVLVGSKVFQNATEDVDKTVAIGYEVARDMDVPSTNNTMIGFGVAKSAGNNGQQLVSNVMIGPNAGGNVGNAGVSEITDCVYIGNNAGLNANGQHNIGIGTSAGTNSNLGYFNVAVGTNACQSQTGGDYNVAIGNDALQQLQTGTTNTAIGKAAGSTVVGFINTTNLGHNSQAQADNEVVLGDNNVTTLRCNTQVISGLSDVRDKDNIEELELGLQFIMDLEPVSWDWDRRDGTMSGKKDSGFVAQELDEVIQDWDAEDVLPSLLNKNNNEAWEVGNAALIPVLVKAIQELKKELDSCKAGK